MTRALPEPNQLIEVTGIMDDPDPMPVGSIGRVVQVAECFGMHQIWVDWIGSTRSLMLLDSDPFRILELTIDTTSA